MTDGRHESEGWFDRVAPDDLERASAAIRDGSADAPDEWPSLAVISGFTENTDEYYAYLHDVTIHATRTAVREAETADDKQLIHAIRAMDDRIRFLL